MDTGRPEDGGHLPWICHTEVSSSQIHFWSCSLAELQMLNFNVVIFCYETFQNSTALLPICMPGLQLARNALQHTLLEEALPWLQVEGLFWSRRLPELQELKQRLSAEKRFRVVFMTGRANLTVL